MTYKNQHCRGCVILHCNKQSQCSVKSNSNDGIRLGCRLPPSHLSNARTSSALRSVCRRLSACIAIAIAAFMLTACSDGNGMMSFRSSDEAISEYHGFLTNLRKDDKVSVQSLAKAISEWRVLNDSVASCLARDTAGFSHSYPFAAYREIKDSIRIELCRMAMSRQRSYRDLLYLREQTSPYAHDEELHQAVNEAQPFFASLDSLPVYNKDGKQAVYLLMMVQPFMSMDDLSVSVLSEKDKSDYYKLADALPKEMDNLTKQLHMDKKRTADLPMLMMKIYITRL